MILAVYKNKKEQELLANIEPVLSNLGFLCRDVEVLSGKSSTVRVTIDKSPENKDGISIDDCANVHRVLGPMFDVWDPLPEAYTLEVSSPGEKPRLRILDHFREALGENIKFQTLEPIKMPEPAKPRKNWEGRLLKVEDEGSILIKDKEGVEHSIPMGTIKNAMWLRVWTP